MITLTYFASTMMALYGVTAYDGKPRIWLAVVACITIIIADCRYTHLKIRVKKLEDRLMKENEP